jgi:ABC-type transport system involved in cytochrome bd biosynthesis fused ATPase/permease subunit
MSRGALLPVAGLGLAALAEGCAIGLLGLSGWFIASSAVAGTTAQSTFSYLPRAAACAPSRSAVSQATTPTA